MLTLICLRLRLNITDGQASAYQYEYMRLARLQCLFSHSRVHYSAPSLSTSAPMATRAPPLPVELRVDILVHL